jgi:hypothetical protein
MPSFKIIPAPQDELETDDAEGVVGKLSIRDDVGDLRQGTLPGTFGRLSETVFWFKYGIQEEFEYPKLDETGTAVQLSEYPISFLENGFIAVKKADTDTTDNLLSLLEKQFAPDVSLETVRFSGDALRTVINDASETIQAQITPKDRSQPERVSGTDRDLPATDFWDNYGDEPLRKIKVNVDNQQKETRVGFDKYGVVILYEQSLTLEEQVEALNDLANTLLPDLITPSHTQRKLSVMEDN